MTIITKICENFHSIKMERFLVKEGRIKRADSFFQAFDTIRICSVISMIYFIKACITKNFNRKSLIYKFAAKD